MKKNVFYLIAIFACLLHCVEVANASQGYLPASKLTIITKSVEDSTDDERFSGWTEEQYAHFEDSVIKELYPEPIIRKRQCVEDDNVSTNDIQVYSNNTISSNVPTSISIDNTKAVGQIPVKSDITATGARTYEVPINVYPGMKGMQPSLALLYNSQQGNSIVGMGWSLSGISTICRKGKTIYYDGKVQSIAMDNDDSFYLDGMRLMKLSQTSEYVIYESETGNIKVKGYISGDAIRYFEIFYPNGNQAIFGFTNNTSSNILYYPITSICDLMGNTVKYSYDDIGNHYNITKIEYNGASVDFKYSQRNGSIMYYSGGLPVVENKLLESIECKFGDTSIGKYSLIYTQRRDVSLLASIAYSAGCEEFNPVKFYYSNIDTANEYTSSTTYLDEWYESNSLNSLKVVKGKFDYANNSDGLIVFPNKNPYWKYHRNSGLFNHSEDKFDNNYSGEEKVFIYTNLKGSYSYTISGVRTGKGFIDFLCANLDGKQAESIIKINDYIDNGYDHLVFEVYGISLYGGLSKRYSREYDYPIQIRDNNGSISINPKYFYTGDFDGDGKMEVLMVSSHQPMGNTNVPTVCRIFDLEGNKVLYEGELLKFVVDFIGTQQSDATAAFNNTDRILVVDYDGDGKSEICHISKDGGTFYSFETSSKSLSAQRGITNGAFSKFCLENRKVFPCELNGDGNTDLLISPTSKEDGDNGWNIFYSEGNGNFVNGEYCGPVNSDNVGFILQDVNGDGKTDLLEYNKDGFYTYLTEYDSLSSDKEIYTNYKRINEVLIPTNLNAYSNSTCLVSLRDSTITKYTFNTDERKECLLTGMCNSFGVIEKTEYRYLTDNDMASGTFSRSNNATFPYVNIFEPLVVTISSEVYADGKRIDYNRYAYHNAIIHRQGLGFRGFEKTFIYNKRNQCMTRFYDPFNFCILKSESTPAYECEYDYSISIQSNKIAKIRLTGKTEKDILKGISATSAYTYDTYGYPTSEIIEYTGDIKVEKEYSYAHSAEVKNGYNLGFITKQVVSTTRGGETCTEMLSVPVYGKRLPILQLHFIDNNQTERCLYSYDSAGNLTQKTTYKYSSTNGQTTHYAYDAYGRLQKITTPLGLNSEYTYDGHGRVASISDARGLVTKSRYDAFGRAILTEFPDGTEESIGYNWASDGNGSTYSIINTATGKPSKISFYDSINREVRVGYQRFDGEYKYIDRVYDTFGKIGQESLPFKGTTPSLWNKYSYDQYDRLISCTEASGRISYYSYSGCDVTTTKDKIETTKRYDALGTLTECTDPAGTIKYELGADGQPISVVSPDGSVTSFTYDECRRRKSIVDPSSGATTYEYDASGNISKETDANGNIIEYSYDQYDRLVSKKMAEFTSSYTYNVYDDVVSVNSSNNTSKTFGYDFFGRISISKESVCDGKWLQKEYSYDNGNVSSIKYVSQSGLLAIENYSYRNGNLYKANVNGNKNIFQLSSENEFGYPTEINKNNSGIKHIAEYDAYGFLTKTTETNSSSYTFTRNYLFDHATSNLLKRYGSRGLVETFGYDNMNRLITTNNDTVSYNSIGNVVTKSSIGSFEYNIQNKPYAVSNVVANGKYIPNNTQEISYSSFHRPNWMEENGIHADFVYNDDYNRVKMTIAENGEVTKTKYYIGNCYELVQTKTAKIEYLYLFGDYYSSNTVYKKGESESESSFYYLFRDHLGSITLIVNDKGSLVQNVCFDAWGRMVNKTSLKPFSLGKEPSLLLDRGYCGHEYLPQFGMINMNARLYDPVLGRFLSPDPFVQSPDMSQSLNRYSYALNNPLRYVDKDGQFATEIILGCAIFGGFTNLATKAASGQVNNFWDGVKAFGVGAVAGAASGIVAVAMPSLGVGGFLGGAIIGAASGGLGTYLQSMGNNIFFDDPLLSFKEFGQNVLGSALIGGFLNGSASYSEGENFWTGKSVLQTEQPTWSAPNTPETTAPKVKENAATEVSKSKPLQKHHFATDKNKTYTPKIKQITDKYELDLSGEWNTEVLPHQGRHPNEYHQWMYDKIQKIDQMPNMNQQRFIEEFNIKVIQPVKEHPEMLYKNYWNNINKHLK